jgi:hypothetical protein
MPTIIPKLKEKMITNSDVSIETIISANKETGNPKMIARFRMFL